MVTKKEAPEALWLAKGDPDKILRELRSTLTWRKQCLFACACCRHMLALLAVLPYPTVIEIAERVAENKESGWYEFLHQRGTWTNTLSGAPRIWVDEALHNLCDRNFADACGYAARAVRDQARRRDWSAARNQQVTILCDILGHLLHPTMTFDTRWLQWNGGTVRKMAEAIYQDNTFADVPILADALEEAGCE